MFLTLSIFLTRTSSSFFVSFPLFDLWNMPLKARFFFDWMSCWFSTIVLLISAIIIIYSIFYIGAYNKSAYFLWFTNMFVASILLVILTSDLFFLMLGWDGLGLISFFLIVYYQNQRSLTSGIFTLLINRLGDGFFLVTILLLAYSADRFYTFTSALPGTLRVFFLILTFITKSALYPFSPWLPLAIAAPTPISALVHSSTLVTSGLYLIIRYSYFLYSSSSLISVLLTLSLFTSFYAGLNALVEVDFKKLIALSTLSHLGFIGLAFSAGLIHMAFFHLLVHALFKSLLFIAIGDVMVNINHFQESRFLSSTGLLTPFSSAIINISSLNLLGLPRMRGYFSKDLILEALHYSWIGRVTLIFTALNVLLTYFYTYKLFYMSFQTPKNSPYMLFHFPSYFHSVLLRVLGGTSVIFRAVYMSYLHSSLLFLPLPLTFKLLPLFLRISGFVCLYLFIGFFIVKRLPLHTFLTSILFLRTSILSLSSNFFYKFRFRLSKTFEQGSFPQLTFGILSQLVANASYVLSQNLVLVPTHSVFFAFFIFSFLSLLLLGNIS